MDQLDPTRRQQIAKASNERLQALLIKAGYDQTAVMEMQRAVLIETYAQYLLQPKLDEPLGAEGGAVGVETPGDEEEETVEAANLKDLDDLDETVNVAEMVQQQAQATGGTPVEAGELMELTELQLRRKELALREQEMQLRIQQQRDDLEMRKLELARQKQKEKKEAEEKEKDRIEREKKEERDRKIKEKELELRQKELDRQEKKDEEEKARRESLAGQTRYYGEALKHSLPKMGADPTEFSAYFQSVENLFTLYDVPEKLQSKLLIPMLNERSKALLAKLPKEQLDDYKQVKDFLLREFKLTAEQYRDKFWSATKLAEETYTLFVTRVKNLLNYYLASRQAVTKDDVIDLFVADRVKQTLSDSCLRHVLSSEGDTWYHPDKLATVVDTYVNSRLGLSSGKGKPEFGRSVRPNSNPNPNVKDFGGVKKSFHPLSQSQSQGQSTGKFYTPTGGGKTLKCWLCGAFGHTSYNCTAEGAEKPRTAPKSLFGKTNKQNPPVGTPKSIPAKINHVSVGLQCESVPHYKLAVSPSRPVLRDSTALDKVNILCKEIEQNAVKQAKPVDLATLDAENVVQTAHVCNTGLCRSDVVVADSAASVNEFDRCAVTVDKGAGDAVARSWANESPEGQEVIYLPEEGNEGRENRSVCFSELQYCNVQLEGLLGPKLALKDMGAEVSVIKQSLVEKLNLPTMGHVTIRGILGAPVEAKLVVMKVKPWPGEHRENIAPWLNVVFATCALSTDVDIILCGTAVDQLSELSLYNVPKPEVTVQVNFEQNVSGGDNERSESPETSECEGQPYDLSEVKVMTSTVESSNDGGEPGDSKMSSQTQSQSVDQVMNADVDKFRDEQISDPALENAWAQGKANVGHFFIKNGLLYHRDQMMGQKIEQLCLPQSRVPEICRLAHDTYHQGVKRTTEKIRWNFYWNKMGRMIKDYVNECHECQLKARAVVKDRVPISVVPRDQVPFSHLYMDIIGPLFEHGEYKYCLCLIDSHTRYPFAYALRSATAKAVCDCLVDVFSRVGIPSVITSDQGTCFTADLSTKFLELFGCKPIWSTPLHPEGNSLVERLNQTFKKMLSHVCKKHPKQWHKLVPLVLWNLRESKNQTLGVSPFMMMMGRNPTNPLSLIRENWTGANPVQAMIPAGKTVTEYLTELQSNLKEIHDFAQEHADREQQNYVAQYNKRAVDKQFEVGQQVIVLIPDSTKKLLSRWQGPGTIVETRSPYSYLVELEQGQRRWLHANKLRHYHARINEVIVNNCSIVYEADEEFGTLPVVETVVSAESLPSTRVDAAKLSHLSSEQKQDFLALLDQFSDVFADKPGLCKVGMHEIHVTPDFKPKRLKAYRVPEVLKSEVARQIQELLDLGFIEPSNSEMASPIVCVLKGRHGENGVRMCCDYRYLNKFTRGDAYPTPDISDIIHRVGKAFWISSWDMRSGYYQLLVKPEHRWLTAFVTDFGIYHWIRMPFGLKCASNSFIRAVQQVLQPIHEFCDSYVDDLATFSGHWVAHLDHVRQFLTVLREAGITLKLEKCDFAKPQVTFVGHIIGSGKHGVDPSKVSCVETMKPPTTKKEVRQMLGFFSYFRSYIRGFADLAYSITELTKKNKPNQIEWSDVHQQAFEALKKSLCEATNLNVIEYGQPCGILTDASATSVGCCLIQWDASGNEKPIAFASAKLSAAQMVWSTIEREAYAVIFALRKFRNFVFATKITVFSDHNPLVYLRECAPKSAKLTRWALGLQEFDITWVYRPGCKNQAADCLSRLS